MTAAERMAQRVEEGVMRRRERISIEHSGGGGDNGGMDDLAPRVAVLEHIAKDTAETLKEIQAELRETSKGIQAEFRETSKGIQAEFRDLRKDMNAEFKAVRQEGLKVALWLLGAGVVGFAALFGLIAHGFHWIG